MKYKSIVITRKGQPEVLKLVEQELREPEPNEVRVRILCTGVGFTDVIMRYGYYPYAPKIPFAPGYEIVGLVDALGQGVSAVSVGQRVAALTVHGGYAEYIYLKPEQLVPVPEGLDSAEAVSLVLNYVTAYQMLHRIAQVKAGDQILITGAAGGVGNAMLQLGKLAGLEMYGTASKARHQLVSELGGIPIDYKAEDFVKVVKQKTGAGVHAAFDAVGGANVWKCYRTLRPKGRLVSYGASSGVKDGKSQNIPALGTFGLLGLVNVLPDGKKATFYGVTAIYRKDTRPFLEDLPKLFELLAQQKIKPIIAKKMPLLEAKQANELLEKGGVNGKIVLEAPLV